MVIIKVLSNYTLLLDDDKKLLFRIMKFLSNQDKSIKELNKLTIYFYKKIKESYNKEENPLKQYNIPEQIIRSYFSKMSDISQERVEESNIERNDEELIDIFKSTNEFIQNYEHHDDSTIHDFLIEKPEELKRLEEELLNSYDYCQLLTIDSRDINYDIDNINNYSICLERPIKNVNTIELLSAEIPNTNYIINEYNNLIYFRELNSQINNNEYYQAEIQIGNYNISDLLTEIQNKMNSTGSSSYTLSLMNNHIKISSDLTGGDGIFNLYFFGGYENHGLKQRRVYLERSMGNILGYDMINLTGENNYVAGKPYDLSGYKNLYLHIDNIKYENIYHNKSFSKIPLLGVNQIKYFKSHHDYNSTHILSPTMDLDILKIRWTDESNNLYNFRGINHSLTFKITSFK